MELQLTSPVNKMFEDSVWQMQVGLQNKQINNLSWKWIGSNTELGQGACGGGGRGGVGVKVTTFWCFRATFGSSF